LKTAAANKSGKLEMGITIALIAVGAKKRLDLIQQFLEQ
jgi:hypothetical protein